MPHVVSSEMRQPPLVRLTHALAALAAVAVACCAWAGGASAKVVTDSVTHHSFSISPPLSGPHAAAATAGTSCTTDCSPLIYHGGPVQHGESVYLLFWLPSGYSFPSGYESGLKTWLDGVASADGSTGNPFSVNMQYYDTSGAGGSDSYVPYAVHDAGTIVDTDPYPASGCTDKDASGTAQPVCITDGQIQSELSSYTAANSLPTGIDVQYFVLTPQGVGSCFSSSSASNGCSYTGYCGYHSYSGSGSSQIVYADMPWAYQVSGCDVNSAFGTGYPNQGGIDPVLGVFSHELSETMTDPNLNAWYDSSSNEIGDKCAYTYGGGGYGSMSGLNRNGTAYWNVPLTGGDYLMQTEYDQRDGDCAVGLTTTWSGEWTAGTGWSQSGNWAGVLPPQSATDTLAFPALTNPVCTSPPGTGTCYSSVNDMSGLTAHAISIDDGMGYSISGDGLTVGSGGVTATTSASSPTASAISLPLTLSAPQTWTISGAAGGGGGLALSGGVSGAGDALGVQLSNRATLSLTADDEVGPATVSGANAGDSGANANQNGTLTSTSRLNGGDSAVVSLSDVAMVTGATTSSGPLTSTGASLQVGQGHAGSLSVGGALSLDPASLLTLFLDGPGTSAGSDYSQIRATGTVNLSGTLALASGTVGCPTLVQGQADTLITTTGSLSGTFAGMPNGSLVTLPCGAGAPVLQITYTANAVTATAVSSAPFSFGVPAIDGLAEPGQVLTETPGVWGNAPTGVVDQWERCDSAGANCSPITGVSGQQYTLTSGDLGSTIRIEEVASNSNGSTTAWSAATAVVAVPVLPTPQPPGQPSPTPAAGSSTPAAAAAAAPASTSPPRTGLSGPTTASIRAALLELLASAGKPARVGALLTHGGYSVSMASPGAGVVVVSWSVRGAKPNHGKHAGDLVVVALGRAGSARAGAWPLKIRLTRKGRRLLARRGTLTVTVTITFTPAGSHQTVTTGRTFTVHR